MHIHWNYSSIAWKLRERQRLSIAVCLLQDADMCLLDADMYLLDEPSAYLDVEQRLAKARVVVEHDLVSVDYLPDRLIVFSGIPGVEGEAQPPWDCGTE